MSAPTLRLRLPHKHVDNHVARRGEPVVAIETKHRACRHTRVPVRQPRTTKHASMMSCHVCTHSHVCTHHSNSLANMADLADTCVTLLVVVLYSPFVTYLSLLCLMLLHGFKVGHLPLINAGDATMTTHHVATPRTTHHAPRTHQRTHTYIGRAAIRRTTFAVCLEGT